MTQKSGNPAQRPAPLVALGQSITMDRAPNAMRLIQISDPHLFADRSARLLGVSTWDSFESVLSRALDQTPPAHGLVLTGDLIHDESPHAYLRLGRALHATGLPCFCIPGNHDRRDLMANGLGMLAMPEVSARRLWSWNLIFLDSAVAGLDGGRLGEVQLKAVDEILRLEQLPTLIFLHHHPCPVGSAWMDTMGVENGEELLEICDHHPNVRALVFGHIHQSFAARRNGYSLLGAPSTCVQFLPGSADFAMDELTPGYRELVLHSDGRLETSVTRIHSYPQPLRLAAAGY